MPLNRIVVLLTPLVFAPLAGYITVQAAKLGVDLPKDQVLKVVVEDSAFILGALIAWAKAHHWLTGWQKAEARADA